MIAKKTETRSKANGGIGKGEQVRIQNRFAGRPLIFQIPGQSIRLGPGESTTVSMDCLATNELRGLCASGLIVVETPTRKNREKATRSGTTSKPVRETRKASPAKAKGRPSASSPKKNRGSASKAGSSGAGGVGQ